jgi:transposase
MADAKLDARQECNPYRRIEVITGQRRRRRWTARERARIVAVSFEGGVNISEVARRNGVVRGLLTVWRHKLAVGVNARSFVPVRISSEGSLATVGEPGRVTPAHTMLREMASPPSKVRGVIEIKVSAGAHLGRAGVDATTLSAALSVLRGGR